jgi:hypothetical protein
MSLNAAAQHLAAHGRGPDTTLVHMSRGEVDALQNLAHAHGGSISINPNTGLPEAGFLSSILPMVAGVALNAFMPGLGAIGSGLLTGAATGLLTGNLNKGIMAGLGAYGGFGLMGGLSGAGADIAAQGAYGAGAMGTDAAAQAAGFGSAEEMAQIQAAKAMQTAKASPFSTAFEGVKGLGDSAGRSSFMNNIGGGKELLKYGAAAAAPLAMLEPTTKAPESKPDTDPGQRYKYSPKKQPINSSTDPFAPEQEYFKPTYTPIGSNEARNIYGYADGGTTSDPDKYTYDPRTQTYQKVAPVAASQTAPQGTSQAQAGRGGVNPQQSQVNSYFNNLSPEGLATHQANQASVINAIMPFSLATKAIQGMLGNKSEGESSISPMAAPSLAASKLGDAAQMGLGYLAFKLAKPNPNPDAVQVTDMSSLSDAAKGEQAQQQAQQAQQAQAISTALAGLQGVGTTSGVGFGAPGPTSGNVGALNAAGMNGANSTGAPAGATSGLSGISGPGMASTSPGNAVSSAMGGQAAAAAAAAAAGGNAKGGLMAAYAAGGSHLGDYSDGGRLLKGPGDGVSDSIPAMIGRKQPARLADGEFVVPARIVSELGNGSTEAGARKLYAMMDRVQKARGQTVGKGRIAKNSRADKHLPA